MERRLAKLEDGKVKLDDKKRENLLDEHYTEDPTMTMSHAQYPPAPTDEQKLVDRLVGYKERQKWEKDGVAIGWYSSPSSSSSSSSSSVGEMNNTDMTNEAVKIMDEADKAIDDIDERVKELRRELRELTRTDNGNEIYTMEKIARSEKIDELTLGKKNLKIAKQKYESIFMTMN